MILSGPKLLLEIMNKQQKSVPKMFKILAQLPLNQVIVFCCVVFPVSTLLEKFESMRKHFPCYQDHKKVNQGKILPAKGRRQGW